MMPTSHTRPALRSDQRGASITEFGLIAPVFFTLLLGTLDLGHTLYMQSILQGAVQKTARDASLESGTTAATQTLIDARVTAKVKTLAKNATVTYTRRYFRDFTKAAQSIAEPTTDTNGNGTCDAGEPFQDNNNNGHWDKDGGDDGQGGAKDAVIYTANISYPRLFPMAGLIGMSSTSKVVASTILANQPYGEQGKYGDPVPRNCT